MMPPAMSELTSRQVVSHLLRLSGPIIAAMISRTVMSFVDFVMVSKLGTEAQAAIVPAGLTLFCVIGLGMGTMTAVNTLVAQSFGRGRMADCAAFTWQGVHIALLMGLAVLPLLPWVAALFGWVGHEAVVQSMETDYTRIGLYGVAPTVAAIALANFFNGIHRPVIGLVATVVSNVFNVVANYALIFGHFGFEAMGIAGAAWATLAGATLQLVILLAWFLRPTIHHAFASRRTWRVNGAKMRKLVWLGAPTGAAFGIDLVSWTIFTMVLIGRFGTVHLAAGNLSFKLLELSFMPGVGLGHALLSAVGKCMGAGRPDHARLYVRWGRILVMSYMGAMAVVYVCFGRPLAGLLTDNPEVAEVATTALLFCAAFQVFDAMHIVYANALRGACDVHWPTYAMLAASLILLLGGGYTIAELMPQWQSYGPWAATTLYIAVYGVALWLRYRRGHWERIELLDEDQS